MATCTGCNSTIVFGGVKDGPFRFCGRRCHENSWLVRVAAQIPPEVVDAAAKKIHSGQCPECGGVGPVDVHSSHFAWSILVITSWQSTPKLSCRGCGLKRQALSALGTAVVGWWGFPLGLIITPIQLARNAIGMLGGPDAGAPSEELKQFARIFLAQNASAQVSAQRGERAMGR